MKTILITGGGSGIGRATAHLFAARGWFVGVADVDERGIAQTLASLPAERARGLSTDVRRPEDWARTPRGFTVVTTKKRKLVAVTDDGGYTPIYYICVSFYTLIYISIYL